MDLNVFRPLLIVLIGSGLGGCAYLPTWPMISIVRVRKATPATPVAPAQSVAVSGAVQKTDGFHFPMAPWRQTVEAPQQTHVAESAVVDKPVAQVPVKRKSDRVAESFARGVESMKTGNDAGAVIAFVETVQLDPGYTEAWERLAILYERAGDTANALDAFKRSKAGNSKSRGPR